MEAIFGPLEMRIKKIASIQRKFFRKQPGDNLFDHKWNEEIFERVESRAI